MISIVSLCAGEASRFGGKPKHMLEVEGETLASRAVRQFGSVRFVTHSEIPDSQSACDTFLFSERYWSDITIILLGDVYYAECAVSAILCKNDPFIIFSDTVDIFAIRFARSKAPELADAAAKAIRGGRHNGGRLWEIYRIHQGLPPTAHLPEVGNPHLCLLGGPTQDFDTLDEYKAFLEGKPKNYLEQWKLHS